MGVVERQEDDKAEMVFRRTAEVKPYDLGSLGRKRSLWKLIGVENQAESRAQRSR